MSIAVVIDALALPANTLVNQRIPKKLLVEQGAPTSGDKRQILDGIEDLQWIAALKPANIGVPAFRNNERDYLEIAVLTTVFRPHAKVSRLTELIHRAIPYPLLLVSSVQISEKSQITISAAHKRPSQNETGRNVIDEILKVDFLSFEPELVQPTLAFLSSLALSKLSTHNLYLLYQGWIDCILGLTASRISGQFILPKSIAQVNSMRESINRHTKAQEELTVLRTLACKEKQINRLIELNIKIKRLELQLSAAINTLYESH